MDLALNLVHFGLFAGDQFAVHMEMDAQLADLQAVFTDLRSGVVPAMSTEELASQISAAINHSLHILQQSPHSITGKDTDMTAMFLTLTGKIISKLSSKTLPQDACVFYEDIMKRLFGASDLTAILVSVDFHCCSSFAPFPCSLYRFIVKFRFERT